VCVSTPLRYPPRCAPCPLRQLRVPPFRPVRVAGEPGFGEHHELRAVAPSLLDCGARARHARLPVHERWGFLGDGDLYLLPTAKHLLGNSNTIFPMTTWASAGAYLLSTLVELGLNASASAAAGSRSGE
jgi:hypothetical protein